MKMAILGDMHLISPEDPYKEAHVRRRHFAQTWESLTEIGRLLRQEAPDLVISVGDLTDWYSDENRDLAVELMNKIGAPWVVTPGNHDLHGYIYDDEGIKGPFSRADIEKKAWAGWAAAGVELGNRVIDTGAARLLLVDSSEVGHMTELQAWLTATLASLPQAGAGDPIFLFMHAPLKIKAVLAHMESIKPGSNGAHLGNANPDEVEAFFQSVLHARVNAIFSGHLHHFPGTTQAGSTMLYLLPLSCVATAVHYPRQGTVTILETDGSAPRFLSIA